MALPPDAKPENAVKLGYFASHGDRINRYERNLACKRRLRAFYSVPNVALISNRVSTKISLKFGQICVVMRGCVSLYITNDHVKIWHGKGN